MTLALRAASFAPDTFDEAERTIEVVLSTGADVNRGGFIERLPIANADLRGIAGKPVLDAHAQHTTRAVLGVIQKAWRKDGEIRALLKLSSRDEAAGTVRDIADGILRNLSVGYRVTKWADSTNSKGERIRTALAWIIHEASFVPIGADAGAVTRSNPVKKKPVAGAPASEEIETPEAANEDTVTQTRAAVRDVLKRAIPNDFERVVAEADAILDADGGVAEANTRALEIMQERTSKAPRVAIVASHEDPAAIMLRRQAGLYARVTGTKPADDARAFVNERLVDHARAFLAARNVPTLGMSEFDIITRANSTSDFPLLLEGTGNRILLEAFEAAQTPLLRLGRTATAPDFRTLNRLRISELGVLKKIDSENAELQNVERSEITAGYGVDSAGLIFSLTNKAKVNDDLSAFADFGRAAAVQAAQYQKKVIIDLIESNPQSEDGNALFSAAHGNISDQSQGGFVLISGSLGPLSEARFALRTQKGLDGVTPLNLAPKFLVVPADLETAAQQVLAQIQPAQVGDVNPFSGSMDLLVESALAEGNWYAFANPAACPVFEHAWLQGYTGPQLASQENFRTLATDWRCVIHWGAGLLPGGWRGVFKNRGSESSNS